MLSVKKQRAISAMLQFPTRDEAAQACGLTRQTLAKYLRDPEFAQALEGAQSEALADALHGLSAGFRAAVTALVEIAQDPHRVDAARVAAARAVLEFGLKYSETVDLEHRVAALESGACFDVPQSESPR